LNELTYLLIFVTALGDDLTYLVATFSLLILRRDVGIKIFTPILITMAVNQIVKYAFNVPRPPNANEIISYMPGYIRLLVGGEGPSLPSGHTQVTATFWGTLALIIRNTPSYLMAVLMPLIIAYSRVALGLHTVMDVLIALVLGYLIPVAYWLTANKLRSVYKPVIKLVVVPSVALLLLLSNTLKCINLAVIAGLMTTAAVIGDLCSRRSSNLMGVVSLISSLTLMGLTYLAVEVYRPSNYLMHVIYAYLASTMLSLIALKYLPLKLKVLGKCSGVG